MMLVSCEEMQRIEKAAFARGVDAGALMEEAGYGLAKLVHALVPRPGRCVAYCGKGNNAGDALVALRHLQRWGWQIAVDLAHEVTEFAPLPAEHFARLDLSDEPGPDRPVVALDGLLGIGARGEPRGEIAMAIGRLNRLRENEGATVVAIDIPSGLNGDTGLAAATCVVADITATIALAKRGLLADAAANFVGRLALIPLNDLAPAEEAGPYLSEPQRLRAWWPPRTFDIHKGICGRVGIIAGSHGMTGAARLCSAAAVAAGAGLVTLYAKEDVQAVLASACVPEVMVKPVQSYREVLEEPMDTLAVGPGLGKTTQNEITGVVQNWPKAMVVDADALNGVALDTALLRHCAGPRLLTPHPGEMQRLFPRGERGRLEWMDAFLDEYPVTLLLKGSRTIVGDRSGTRYYNSTGNPGMASGGMGDVLTGVTAALIHQCGNDLLKSAVLGAWICGRAAELAVAAGESPESLSAHKVVDFLGAAFKALRQGY